MKNIYQMTKEEKLGQLVWVGFQGYEFNENLKYLIDKYKVGNIILFTRNIKDIKQLFELNKQIHEYVLEKTGVMPFISIDQEGGMVTRIMDGATFCPGNMTLATSNVENAYKIGKLMGEELRALGINYNLAPSLDINNNPNNPVIGVRSYSDKPEVVGEYGLNYIRGLQSTGVIGTAKHFPGHGDTNVDSHKALAAVMHDQERLENVELVPFKKVIGETQAIMTAHLLFPAYEKENVPATLSRRVITDLLRNRLGFEGLITSDCMEMKAIDDHYTTPKGCLMGLQAGLDQVMVSATYEKQLKTFELLHEAYDNNQLDKTEIDQKLVRIMKAKEMSYNLMKEHFYGKTFDDVKDIIDDQEHKALATKIVDESLTLVKGKNIDISKKTLVITTEPFATTIAEDELSNRSIGSAIKEAKLSMDVERIKVSVDEDRIKELVRKAKDYEQVLVCTYNANMFTKQADLVNQLYANIDGEKLFVLSTRSPYDLFKFNQIKNYLCLYEYTPNSVNTIAKYLKGEIQAIGKLPISLSRQLKVGASLYVGLKEYPIEKNLEYLKLLKEEGVDLVFISAHIPEMSPSFKEELVIICNKALELGVKVSLDVAKPIMKSLNLPKVYALRLDYGFSLDEIVEMYDKQINENGPVVELNASTIDYNDLLYLQAKGVNLSKIRISHNFYPKKWTGLSADDVIKKNEFFHKLGMNVMIYIPSSNQHRPPMYEGLPTVELHRELNIYGILSTMRYLGADEVFFGDAYASCEELRIAKKFNYDEAIIPIIVDSRISLEEKELLTRKHINRRDANEYFVRSSTRVKSGEVLPLNTSIRRLYDVTIDNVKFGRYQGEVCIMKKELPADERVNVVAKALINDLVIKSIFPSRKFRFVIVGEYDS